jgi:hypothetical protein
MCVIWVSVNSSRLTPRLTSSNLANIDIDRLNLRWFSAWLQNFESVFVWTKVYERGHGCIEILFPSLRPNVHNWQIWMARGYTALSRLSNIASSSYWWLDFVPIRRWDGSRCALDILVKSYSHNLDTVYALGHMSHPCVWRRHRIQRHIVTSKCNDERALRHLYPLTCCFTNIAGLHSAPFTRAHTKVLVNDPSSSSIVTLDSDV